VSEWVGGWSSDGCGGLEDGARRVGGEKGKENEMGEVTRGGGEG
jgi:hypothetical protein